ncbi:RNA polymerase sigma factor [Methylorubrum populi]|uniref:RNA polymerase sigma factor n=1 Tax=Methylorubrum populi TaxID=223967 RepID=A0A160PF87_9HYPH|nr:RNA polymerase sigma factor [Methylorubrum populi]
MRALAPFSWLSRWLDRRIDARIAAHECAQPVRYRQLAEEAAADIRAVTAIAARMV